MDVLILTFPGDGMKSLQQMDLFRCVSESYAVVPDRPLDNSALYNIVAAKCGISTEKLSEKTAIGKAGAERSLIKRSIRWHQQTLKHMGLLEKVPAQRGLWQLTKEGKRKLHRAAPGVTLLAFSTDLGIAIWGDCRQVFSSLDVPIHLVITSPPYPLRQPRAYGNPKESEYVDFICSALEPVVAKLADGASVCLNISNDIFEQGSPARSLYVERLVIALNDRLGLSLMDRLIWHNPSKPPGPVLWASIKRVQLNVAYEPVFWFTNNPRAVRSDNRRVLEPHTERHKRLIAAGGCQHEAEYADGAYRRKVGSYGNDTPGRIPRNVISLGHQCADHKEYRRDCEELGLPKHGAPMPLSLPDFLIRFMSLPGDLVADPFGGKLTTAMAAETLGRRWICSEWIYEYVRGASERFKKCAGFQDGFGTKVAHELY